jgi:hypothetical protein
MSRLRGSNGANGPPPLHSRRCTASTYVQELGLPNAWISEAIFWLIFISCTAWSFSPFVVANKRFYTAVLYARLLTVLSGECLAKE